MNVTLFIVDDEELIRTGLVSLPWSDYDIDIVGSAQSGEEALEKIKQLRPDIVISDIEMPKRNGLWLAEQALTLLPSTKFVFLTGFNTFEYVHRAMHLKVTDYVLKPIKKAELFELISKIRDSIINERKNEEKLELFYDNLKESKFFLKSWFFDMLSGFYKTHDTSVSFDFLGTSVSDGQFCVMLIKLQPITASAEEQFESYLLFRQLLSVTSLCDAQTIPFLNNSIITLVFRFDKDNQKALSCALEISQKLYDFLSYNADCGFTIAISEVFNSIIKLPQCSSSAENALLYALPDDEKQIIYAGDLLLVDDLFDAYENYQKQYSVMLSHGTDGQISELLKNLFSLFDNSGMSLPAIRQHCIRFASAAMSALYKASSEIASNIVNPEFLKKLGNCQSSSALCDIITLFSINISHRIQECLQQKNAGIVNRIKAYVSENIAQTITLEILSEVAELSPNYISTLFYKETGINFKDYLISVRIDKAKELLKNTQLKIYEVANAVGYEDTRYFSDVFCRNVGCLPSQYRKR